MNLSDLSIPKHKTPSFFASHLLLLPILFIVVFFIYYSDSSFSFRILVLTILIYSLLTFIIGYSTLHISNHYFIPLLGIVFGFINTIHFFCVLLELFELKTLYMWKPFHISLHYINPFITGIITLQMCKFFAKDISIKKFADYFIMGSITLYSIVFSFNRAGFVFTISPSAIHWMDYMRIAIIIIIYGACAFFLWKQEKLIPRSLIISMFIFFILIISSEVLIIVNQYYNIGVFTYLVTVCALYNLYNTQIQYCILYRNDFSPNKDELHSLNTLIMNKHLSFKSKEVDSLRTQIETKNKLYKNLLEFFPGAFLISCKDTIVYVNSAGLALLEIENCDDVINQPIWNFIHPDYISFVRLNYASLEPTDNNTTVNTIKILSVNKEVKEVEVSSTPAYLDNTYYIISSVRDLTERNHQEHLQLELEKAITHEKSKVEFFINISHDLKTPVNVIYSAIQLQDIYVQSSDLNKIQMYNNVIKQNCLRLQKLLNDLLDITRIDANHFSVRLKLCNVISLIENITQSVTAYVEHKNISIIFDTNVEEKFTMTDPDLIERILLNLLSNAIKYGKENGHIWVTLNAQDDHLVVSIRDDGIGIPNDQLNHIFERFIKGKNNSPSRGSGIGLSLVKAIIEILGGTISCISQENEGTEFIIHLPTIPCYDQNTTHTFVDSLEIDDQFNIELSNI